MKLFRFFILSLVALFGIASFIGVLLPSKVLVSRAVDIKAPKDSIFPELNNVGKWKNWIDGLQQADPSFFSSSKVEIGGTVIEIKQVTDSTVVSLWTGKNGDTQISTIRVIANPFQNITVVQWQFEQRVKWYPWERLGSMMNDKILGTMMEKNLNNLRLLAEHQ